MEVGNAKRVCTRGIEENVMAIIESAGVKDTRDAVDDRMAFLEAVRAAYIVPGSRTRPTNKIYAAIFQILRHGRSLELLMTSYQLLDELDKVFPRVHLSNADISKLALPIQPELVATEEVWSPFAPVQDSSCTEREAGDKLDGSLDSSGFHALVEGLAAMEIITNFQELKLKTLGNMLLFQYLVNVLEGDFFSRKSIYKDTTNWMVLRESSLNVILGSRKSHICFVKNCLSIMSAFSHIHGGIKDEVKDGENFKAASTKDLDAAFAMVLLEMKNSTCTAVERLLTMIMELDMLKKKADMQGSLTRADGIRTPVVEIIVDEFTYRRDTIPSFLQVFNEPKWKMEIVLKYISNYVAKPSVRTRRSNVTSEDVTLGGVLNCFFNSTSAKNFIKKLDAELVQLLLAYAFQAYFSLSLAQQLPSQQNAAASKETAAGSSLVETCKSFISAFENLKRAGGDVELLPIAKEALFTAATILSAKS